MPELTSDQRELAAIHGVAVQYEDFRHTSVSVPAETVLSVLAALGVAADEVDAATTLASYRREQESQVLPPCIVMRSGRSREVTVAPAVGPLSAEVETEDADRISLAVTDDTLTLPADLRLGYHQLCVTWPGGGSRAALVVTPEVLGLPPALRDDRAWGLAAQLYSVRSAESWGVGDLADLSRLASWAGSNLGADFVLVNPLSAAEPIAPMEPSPYLPSSRSFVNPLYLRVEEIPEYADLPPAGRALIEELRDDVHVALDNVDAIDRDASWTRKLAALRLVHQVPRSPERDHLFRTFVEDEGAGLRDFATWCTLVEEHGASWRDWPPVLQHPDNPAVQEFRAAAADSVEFFCWLQWVLDDQLAAAQGAAMSNGMRVGIMHDLAVGVHRLGADAWRLQDELAQGVTVGAPPDAFNQVGQDWSQPPWRPDRLAALGYAPYRNLIRRLLRHAGALRIDHIVGLFRLWWIPAGAAPGAGTYVYYDHEALVGILALEAQRAGAVVVGEDLGNVEPSARDYLAERGIAGTSILWFERDADGRPLPAEKWRELCLASVTTHDLPPTAGYLAGVHVDLRDRLDLLAQPVEDERAADEAERQSWLDVLVAAGDLAPDADVEDTVVALHRYLTRAPSRLLCVSLADAVGDRRAQNQPGTSDEYPNWRIPLTGPMGEPVQLEDVMTSALVRRVAAAVGSRVSP